MIRAIIFDFNDVIADDEAPHLRCFQQTLAKHGLSLTKDDYYGTYLDMDERTCNRDLPRAIMDWKATHFREYTTIHKSALFPGGVKFVKRAWAQYR